MSIESIESDDKLFERFCVRRPPELNSREAETYSPPDTGRAGQARCVEAQRGGPVTGYVAPAPGSRPGWVARPPVSEGERLGIIATEAWEAYLVEWESPL